MRLSKKTYNAMLLDFNMEDIYGYEVAEQTAQGRPEPEDVDRRHYRQFFSTLPTRSGLYFRACWKSRCIWAK